MPALARPLRLLLRLLLLRLLLLGAAAALAAAAPTTAASVNVEANKDKVEANKDNYIAVNGGYAIVSYADGDYLSVRCDRAARAALDDAALALGLSTRVVRARFAGCEPPRAGYAAALRRLGVRLLPRGKLALELPAGGAPLSAEHLARLDLAVLQLAAASRRAPPPPPAPRALAGLALAQLEVRGAPLPREALAALPPGLAALTLVDAGAVRVPERLLAALTDSLSASDEALLEGGAPARAVSLTLARGAAPRWARFPAARRATLTRWNEAPGRAWEPRAWADCANVTSLTLVRANFSSLPARWLGACGALTALELSGARALTALPDALLEGECAERAGRCAAPALTRLLMRYGALRSLPEKLFDPVPNLRYLDFTANELLILPGGIFARPVELTTLILAGNKFADGSVYKQLAPLHRLSTLDLSKNRDLPDACSGSDYTKSGLSDLKELKNLTKLNLSSTSVSRICSDWRVNMLNLQELRLHDTRITRLSFDDLQYKRRATLGPKPRVELLGSPVRTISYSVSDEALAAQAPPAAATVVLNEPLACDCELFRAMRAIRTHVEHADLAGALACGPPAAPRPLLGVPLDDMLCARPALCRALPGCACAVREQGGPAAPRWLARASCERAALRRLPALPEAEQALEWDLRLADNDIEALDDLPPSVRILDLRNNRIERVSEAAAAAIGGLSALRLAGNPLACNCSALPLLEALATLPRNASDAPLARCGDGRALALAAAARHACLAPGAAPPPPPLPLLAALGAVLVALAGGALALAFALAAPARRARLKGLLLRWGWLPRGAEADDARPYDVFVSFAHEDAAFARELAAALEAGAAPLRLCVHSRDWAPGEYIAAQIAASVRGARRTLCVVSRHWCGSRWARAELREARAAAARDGAPRLVLVLLEDAEALAPLDAELRRSLATCTYLRRDHPRFWQRLREALPQPRPPPPPAPPAPAPAPAATPAPPAA